MKSIRVFIIGIALTGVFVLIAAFMNLRNEKIMKNLKTTEKNNGFAVVELFTSEGCSSCPPADELIEMIQQDNKNKEIYILAFHVDYWDHQGWKDTFSDPEFSKRQRQYANWLKLRIVYTPQIVFNGTKDYVGSDQGPILSAISNALNEKTAKSLTLNVSRTGAQLTVDYQGAGADKNSELVLALIQKTAHSKVRGGENSGRSLSHVQIVRQLSITDLNLKESIKMNLPADFKEKGWELIGFVQHKTDGRITAAARFDFDAALNSGK